MSITKRLYLVLFAVGCVLLVGSGGYYALFGGRHSFLDCVYMTVISLTTVGYGEVLEVTGNVPAQIFTMILITFGGGIILYGISNPTAVIIEAQLSGLLRIKSVRKRIRRLEKHYIVCGGGQTGWPVVSELLQNAEPVVLIEADQSVLDRCCGECTDLLTICGDAIRFNPAPAVPLEPGMTLVVMGDVADCARARKTFAP